MTLTRRDLGRLFLTVPAAGLLPREALAALVAAKPDSKFAGVQIGMNVPYNYGGRAMPVDDVIAKTAQLNVSAVELRWQPIELFLGVPQTLLEPGREKAAQDKAKLDLREWRLKNDPPKAPPGKKKFKQPG